MEMYGTMASCTVDGEVSSWCLTYGLACTQSTLNTHWDTDVESALILC